MVTKFTSVNKFIVLFSKEMQILYHKEENIKEYVRVMFTSKKTLRNLNKNKGGGQKEFKTYKQMRSNLKRNVFLFVYMN